MCFVFTLNIIKKYTQGHNNSVDTVSFRWWLDAQSNNRRVETHKFAGSLRNPQTIRKGAALPLPVACAQYYSTLKSVEPFKKGIQSNNATDILDATQLDSKVINDVSCCCHWLLQASSLFAL